MLLNSSALRWRRNVVSDGTLLSVDGRVFQARAAATENARSPSRRDDESWRSSRPEMATCRHVRCELQGLGEIRRRGAMKTAVRHNTEEEEEKDEQQDQEQREDE